MKRVWIPALFLGATALLAACGRDSQTDVFSPTESCLFLSGEGTVTSVTVEKYDSPDYNAEELTASVEEYLAAFNGDGENETKTPRARLKECSMADGTAVLQVEFQNGAAYLEFMKEYPDEESAVQVKEIDVVSVPDGIAKGYLAGAAFQKADKKEVSSDEVMKQTKLFVAAVEGPALIETDGQIQYVSEGVELLGNTQARTSAEGVSYLVFR